MATVTQAYIAGYHAGYDGLEKICPCKDENDGNEWIQGYNNGVEDREDVERQMAA